MDYSEEAHRRFQADWDEYDEQENREFLAFLEEPLGTPPPNWDYIRRLPMEFIFDETFHNNVTPWDDYDLLGADDADLLALEEGMPDLSDGSIENAVLVQNVQQDSVVEPLPLLPDAAAHSWSADVIPRLSPSYSMPPPRALRAPSRIPKPARSSGSRQRFNRTVTSSLRRSRIPMSASLRKAVAKARRPRRRVRFADEVPGASPAALSSTWVEGQAMAPPPLDLSRIVPSPLAIGAAGTSAMAAEAPAMAAGTSAMAAEAPLMSAGTSAMAAGTSASAAAGAQRETSAFELRWRSFELASERQMLDERLQAIDDELGQIQDSWTRMQASRASRPPPAAASSRGRLQHPLLSRSSAFPARPLGQPPIAGVSSRVRVPLRPGSIASISLPASRPPPTPSTRSAAPFKPLPPRRSS